MKEASVFSAGDGKLVEEKQERALRGGKEKSGQEVTKDHRQRECARKKVQAGISETRETGDKQQGIVFL